jgi:hypothetical protein
MNITKLTSTIAPRSAFVVPTLGCSNGTSVVEGFGAGYAATMRERHVDAADITATPGTHAWRPPIT